ncbi:MAG: type II toxin-antitoxin system prevent-host-death family antitoxin [Kiritimatiellia bacterium]|jgi:prevent-host-death family protein
MIDIQPVSNLRNNFSAIEKSVQDGWPVYLTKNGYGSMVVLSLARYAELTNGLEMKLGEAGHEEDLSATRLSHKDVFEKYQKRKKRG